jgi:pimeloyl-ACP methyl ester carboxylesterase
MINLRAITEALPVLEAEFLQEDDRYPGEVLFLLGGRSDYFQREDEPRVAVRFPRARLLWMPEVGHNPHFEAREQFVRIVVDFLEGADP